MALWAKIQSLNNDCQRQILSLYDEDHKDYRFPIEVRNLFAQAIEEAVCGGGITLEKGLDPYNTQHRDSIINFFKGLAGLLEERLGNPQSGDQFFTRHKLSESLTNIKEKSQNDPLGMFEHIRNRIKVEMDLIAQHEAASNNDSLHEKDIIMDNIQDIKSQIASCGNILKDIHTNEEHFALNCNKKQEIEGILTNPEQLRSLILQCPDYEMRLRENLATLEGLLQQNIRTLQILMQRFEQTISNNLKLVMVLKGQIVNDKLAIWKHEQQQMANGINKTHSVSLDKLQVWCEELSELIWKNYLQLKEAERMLQNGAMQTGNASDLTFVQSHTEEVVKLLEDLLNHSLIVEDQPPQIIKMKTKFPKPVVVSLLVGKRLNIQMNAPSLSTTIISEEQAKNLNITDQVEIIGEITNGSSPMDCREDMKRLSVTFKSMQLKTIKRTDRRGSVTSERVMEEKSCLYFACSATVGPLMFRVSTISLPVVVISHGSQEALAVATISWDNAFGEIGRVPFKVRTTAAWSEVSQILNAKFVEVAKRGLTEGNLACLAQKAFRHRRPQPETISWAELCKDNLPGRNFTFWAWFHTALKLIEKKETHLKELWSKGLIMGFIEREAAEDLISHCEPGTFLLRFADSIAGAITITLLAKPGTVVSLSPFQMLDLQSRKLAMSIKELDKLKYLYQEPQLVHKDDAFGSFYDKENTQTAATGTNGSNPYVPLVPTIPDGGDTASGSQTPVPTYDGSCSNQRWSHGSLPGLSPIHVEQSHSPFFAQPPSPYEIQTMSTVMMPMDGVYTDELSATGFLNLPRTTNISSSLDTPKPDSQQHFSFANTTGFDDLITVNLKDAAESMDIQQ
ncbi:Signal transducer and activator of transcription 5A [Orchesella cincta]|uniref:Signal transducer and activator of transcription n=1 Tax=Orchesella cincta TaxID=48709 RepID=A0A1D2N2B5_ORCCI|nr:Signal transducer and activator of transcription 5A [Orchesella cincta]